MKHVLADWLASAIRMSGTMNLPGKNSRFIPLWMSLRDQKSKRLRAMPGGGKVLCDLSIPYECMVWLKQEEQQELLILAELLKPGDIFVDCGANIGIWSLVAAAAVGPLGAVFAFEPNPLTADKLFDNVHRSGFGNVNIRRAALGSAPGEVYLLAESAHNLSRIVNKITSATVKVPVITLDSAMGNKQIAGCKLDVEGFELQILKGAENLLRNQQFWLSIEFNSLQANANTLGQWDVHRLLKAAGYVPRLFKNALRPTSLNILPDSFTINGYCNLFYKRADR